MLRTLLAGLGRYATDRLGLFDQITMIPAGINGFPSSRSLPDTAFTDATLRFPVVEGLAASMVLFWRALMFAAMPRCEVSRGSGAGRSSGKVVCRWVG